MWTSWHDNVGAPMKDDYARDGRRSPTRARRSWAYADTGAMWRSGYDMTPEEFAALTEKMWQEVKPLYMALHSYVRAQAQREIWRRGAAQDRPDPRRPARQYVGAGMGQYLRRSSRPQGAGDLGYDIGDLLEAKGYDPIKMVKTGEGFYSSLGFAPLPDTFWERSQITKPRDREVVCHASAWDIDNKDDLRIKMCTKVNCRRLRDRSTTSWATIITSAPTRRSRSSTANGANDGFHEAIGDFIALSITPAISRRDRPARPGQGAERRQGHRPAAAPGDGQGRVPAVRPADRQMALGRVRRLDHAGRLQQGLDRPAAANIRASSRRSTRRRDAFDPGAKYHVPGNTPYTRYFLARVLQFQFYKAACKQAGWKGPLHRCSLLRQQGGRREARTRCWQWAQSKPWPDALEAFTGSREISGKAMVEYFAPLKKWLDEQNKGKPQGW